jgi:uncharacterized protein (DUF1015 family)
MRQSAPATATGTRPLRLAPFRALRYNPALVPDLGTVTCPPYDVIGADGIAAWEAADPHNVVRLILPRDDHGRDRYAHASRDLRHWLASGLLVRDQTPGLYVYEHDTGAEAALGLVGAVSLHDPSEQRILPHEDVFAGPVADRTALMSATAAQLEPILLTYEGGGPASDVVDKVVACSPHLEAHTSDGAIHRLWRISDPEPLRIIAADLADRQALIADGHHRYAAYRALRGNVATPTAAHSAPTAARSATEFGLALLVDAHRHPLRLGAIHRSVAALSWPDALAAVRRGFRSVRLLPDAETGTVLAELAAARQAAGGPTFALTDGQAAALAAEPDPVQVRAGMPAGRSALWRSLDASVAHEVVLARLWGVDDSDPRVSYHHRADDAAARARATAGAALLLHPADHADVLAIAARGERMPRKSTSFGPKPRTGLLMRLLDE